MNILKGQAHPVREHLAAQAGQAVERHMSTTAVGALTPVNPGERRAAFEYRRVVALYTETVKHQPHEMNRRAKLMTTSTQEAIDTIDAVERQAAAAIDRLASTSTRFDQMGKEISARVRSETERLATGLRKIEATANFEQLERRTVLLERMAAALTTLADLEHTGKLERVIGAMK